MMRCRSWIQCGAPWALALTLSVAAGVSAAPASKTEIGAGPEKPALAGDSSRGAELYVRRCGACHSLDQNRIGPRHRNVFGARAGAVNDYPYSQALKNLDVVWDQNNLNRWLENPPSMAPGTRMGFRLADDQERADIIAYLKSVSEPKTEAVDQE